jgi:CheY-like chemotaxis protein
MSLGEYRKRKILLVEDDLHVRDCFELLLEFDGHEILPVDSGHAALAVLEQRKFDLVVTDYWMPGMNGDELARLIKERWPDQPVIMVGGSMVDGCTFDTSIPGVDCLVNKPFSLAELRAAIVWALDLHADSQLTVPDMAELLCQNSDQTEEHPVLPTAE